MGSPVMEPIEGRRRCCSPTSLAVVGWLSSVSFRRPSSQPAASSALRFDFHSSSGPVCCHPCSLTSVLSFTRGTPAARFKCRSLTMSYPAMRSAPLRSPFPASPTDTLDSHLLTQSLSLLSFSTDFLAPESDHRDWCHTIGPLASGTPLHLCPFLQLLHHPRRPPSPSVYAFPYSSLPLQWTQRLAPGHTLTAATSFLTEAASLPQAADAFLDTLRVVSAVESPTYAGEESRYWQWTGIGRYSAHIGATARLPALSLSSLSPALSQVVPYISSSATATAAHNRLALSHASFRAHVRPFAGAGDRGLLSAETLVTRQEDQTFLGLRLAYTHRLSEGVAEAEAASLSNVASEIERVVADAARGIQNTAQSAAAALASPSLLQRLTSPLASTPQSLSQLLDYVTQNVARTPPPPKPLLPWSFPSSLSLAVMHSSPLPSSLQPSGGGQPRSFRLTDRSAGWLSAASVGVGWLARPRPYVTVQLEALANEQSVALDSRLWLRSSRRRGEDEALSLGNGMFFGGRVVSFRAHPEQSHAALTVGLSYMY